MEKAGNLLERHNLSHDLAFTIREMIVDGSLPAGERINEVNLSAALGVSRTPLREALSALVSEDALRVMPRRGFVVRELSIEEAEGIYPIRALLDPEALRLSGLPSTEQLKSMVSITDRLGKARNVRRAIQLDDDWHRLAWSNCPNTVMVELIEQFMRRTRRYELASMGESRSLKSSSSSKTAINELLRRGDLDTACARLQTSLLNGLTPVAEWLRAQGK